MAESLSHKFGQIIGDVLELAIYPHLEKFARTNKLYLDRKGERTARKGKKVTWLDINGNKHDLDFVLERGGNESVIGTPVAFIESAWRRGSRHSKNKVQEIAGAINPIAEKYKSSTTFKGAILAGDFTKPSLKQLESDNFAVLYFPTDLIVKAFAKYGINVLTNDETAESDYAGRLKSWDLLKTKSELAKELLKINQVEVSKFFELLKYAVSRFIDRIIIIPLYGEEAIIASVNEAIDYLKEHSEKKSSIAFVKYEIIIRYNTGDSIDANFQDKKNAIKFLELYL